MPSCERRNPRRGKVGLGEQEKCFGHGVVLKTIETDPGKREEEASAVKRLSRCEISSRLVFFFSVLSLLRFLYLAASCVFSFLRDFSRSSLFCSVCGTTFRLSFFSCSLFLSLALSFPLCASFASPAFSAWYVFGPCFLQSTGTNCTKS